MNKMKWKYRRYAVVLAAMAGLCAVTACGSSDSDEGENKADFSVTLGQTYEPVLGSGTMSSKSWDIADGEYEFSITGIDCTDSMITVDIAASGSSAEIKMDDNVMEDFDLAIDEDDHSITLTADPDKMYKNINCTVALDVSVNSVEVDGMTKINYAVPQDAGSVEITASGASTVTASGACLEADYQVSGGAVVDASALQAKDAFVNASGAANVLVYAHDSLQMEASGASKVVYSGDPKSVDKNVSGAAVIENGK